MRIQVNDGVLNVACTGDIAALDAAEFRDRVSAAMPPDLDTVEIDLAEVKFINEDGLGALFAIYKAAMQMNQDTTFRIFNPRPSIKQLLELTQLHQLYEISRR